MTKDVMITARIDEELSEQLTRLSTLRGRSKSWMVGKALRSYVEHELAFHEAVEEGRRAVREGRTFSHEEVMAEFEARYGKIE